MRPSHLVLLLAVAALVPAEVSPDRVNLWGQAIEGYFTGMVSARLKKEVMQEMYDDQQYLPAHYDGHDLLDSLSSAVSIRFRELDKLIQNLASEVEGAHWRKHKSEGMSCCTGWRIAWDSAFQEKVNREESCYMTSTDVPYSLEAKNSLLLGNSLTPTFIRNLEGYPSLKWQFFASETGTYRLFPTRRWPRPCQYSAEERKDCFVDCTGSCSSEHSTCTGECTTFDPRLEKWYGLAVAAAAWDVVFLVDNSASMHSVGRWDRVRSAVVDVTRSLTPASAVNVVLFDSKVTLPSKDYSGHSGISEQGCFSSSLVRVSRRTEAHVASFLMNAVPGEDIRDFDRAFSTAFELIQNSYTTGRTRRDTLIVLITGSVLSPSETAGGFPSDVLLNHWAATRAHNLQGRSMPVFAYQLGGRSADVDVLVERTGGRSIVVEDSQLGTELRKFYMHVAKDESDGSMLPSSRVIWSPPSCLGEPFGLATTVVKAVYDHTSSTSALAGVVGFHVPLQALFAEVLSFRIGRSYAFVLDGDGNVVVHPRLRDPIGETGDPVFPSFVDLEKGPAFETLRANILSDVSTEGSRGNITLHLVSSRGDPQFEGMAEEKVLVSYHWRRLPGTRQRSLAGYTIVLALLEEDLKTRSSTLSTSRKDHYHRIDLLDTDAKLMAESDKRYPNKLITDAHSTYKIAPRGFFNSFRYIDVDELPEQANAIDAYINGAGENPPWLRVLPGVVNDIHLTSAIEPYWMDPETKGLYGGEEGGAVWRYIGTSSGVFRTYPGTVSRGRLFDPTTRPWYHRAISHPGAVVFSYPHEDESTKRMIVSISTAIYEGKQDRTAGDEGRSSRRVAAVMGMDLLYADFASMVEGLTGCTGGGQSGPQCFLIDRSGYLITHPSFGQDASSSHVFAGSREGVLAQVLREMPGIFDMKKCLDVYARSVENFYVYTGSLSSGVHSGTTTVDSLNLAYHVRPLENTNIILVVVERTTEGPEPASCQCHATCAEDPTQCQAPCYCDAMTCSFDMSVKTGRELPKQIPVCPALFTETVRTVEQDYSWLLPVVIGSVAIVGGAATSAYVYYRKSNSVSFYFYIASFLLHAPIQYLARVGMFRFKIYLRYVPTSWGELVRVRMRAQAVPLENAG